MDLPPDTSESLIARVKDPADAAAWAQFLAIYRPVVYRMARRKGLQDCDAEDLAQRVFLSISRAIDGWEPAAGGQPFRAWLFAITRNAILNALTRRPPDAAAGSTSVWDLLEEHPAHDPQSTAEFVRESRREAFRWAAEQVRPEFSPTTWAMFWESAVLDRPVEEVARALGRTAGAVYVARCRVMKRLKDKVAEATHGWQT